MQGLRAVLSLVLVFTITIPYSLSLPLGLAPNAAHAQGLVETRALLRLDRALYAADQDCVRVSLLDPDENGKPGTAESVLVHLRALPADAAPEIRDQESMIATEVGTDSGLFRSQACIPVAEGTRKDGDGLLQVQKGDLIGAAYLDKDNPPPPQGPPSDPEATLALYDLAADLAVVAGGQGSGTVQIQVAGPDLLPNGFESTPGASPNEPARPLAMAIPDGGFPVLFGEDQVLLAPLDDRELQDFLQRWGGSVVEQLDIPAGDPNDPNPTVESFFLIRVDVDRMSEAELPYLAEKSGGQGATTLSSVRAARLLALLLAERLGGSHVMLHPVPWAMASPRTDEGGGLDGMSQADWRSPTRAAEAVAYMDLIDRNAERAVRTAIIGGGFARAADYPSATDNPDWGAPFSSLRQANCSTGSCTFGPNMAGGRMSLPCAGGPSPRCDWHDTLAFGIAGAVGDNGTGTMGVAGHARDAGGSDGNAGVIDPVLLRVSTPYFGTLARAISTAVDEGVDVINISGGFACEPVLDVDLCSTATRVALGVACGAIARLLGSIIPVIGQLVARVGCALIFTLIRMAGLNRRDALRSAVDRAVGAGIFIAASGTEPVSIPVLGTRGPFDAEDIDFLPCTLPGVTCVGASNGMTPDAINPNGRGLDIWAPVATSTGAVVPSTEPARSAFSGTSASAPFVAGAAALLKAANPLLGGAAIESILRDTSVPLTTAPRGGCVTRTDGSCTGVVDVLAALQSATGIALTCTGFEESIPGNDSLPLAFAVPVTPPSAPGAIARVEVTSDGGLHALPADIDWFRFSPGGPAGSSIATRVSLSIGRPEFGVPSLELRDAAGSLVAAGPEVERFLSADADYHAVVRDSGSPAIDDNCYNGSTLAIEVMTKPSTDACEPDQTALDACDVSDGWDSYGFLCSPRFPRDRALTAGEDCSSVLEDFAGGIVPEREAHVFWDYDLADLSLDTTGDVDFFRVPVPDPSDPADGGFDDVRPAGSGGDPEPFQDCAYYTRQEPLGMSTTVSTAGRLYVQVVPEGNATSVEAFTPEGEEVRLYGATDASAQPLLAILECPQREGIEELLFSLGERADSRTPFARGGYEIRMTYHVAVTRGIPPGISDRYDPPVGPMPCLNLGLGLGPGSFLPSESFPFCGDFGFLGPVLQLPHPMDSMRTGCENGGGPGCGEVFAFDWPATEREFRIEFSSEAGLDLVLLDAAGQEIARAGPQPEPPTLPQGAVTDAGATQIEQLLWLPNGLEEGRYFLEITGPSALYELRYQPPLDDPDGDRIDAAADVCPVFWNADQRDVDQNGIGDVCECGDQTGDGTVNVVDLVAINLAIFQPGLAMPLCDTNDDGRCSVSDIVGVNLKIFGKPAYCSRWPAG